MTIRILVVDDSRFICNRIQEILEEDKEYKVVGIAVNGQEAVSMAALLKPDVITMDVEMPLMDGITAVKKIMAESPTPILMFSASTQVGAQSTLDALNAGAIDFLPKRLDDIDGNKEMAKRLLRRRVHIVAQQVQRIKRKKQILKDNESSRVTANSCSQNKTAINGGVAGNYHNINPDLLLIAASTGGPVAIQKILTRIPAQCSIPVLLVQHMPENFTKSFAERLNQLCKITVKQAENGDVLQAGVALLSPGGKQMEIYNKFGKQVVALRAKKPGEIYSPCVDITFSSVARIYTGKVLAIVLTGMGADGKNGVVQLKQNGAQIWAQDEASSTIYGMPKAIADARLADRIYSLDEIANEFNKIN